MTNSISMTPTDYTQCIHHSEDNCAILLTARESVLGEGMKIRRLLPHKKQRMIGAWCFFDHAGPVDVSQGQGVRVGPHPHTGLQTFSWMLDGEILHRDSLGYKQLLTKGQVNLMTAGRGISHSEESPQARSPLLQLAQFWIALPNDKRFIEPAFEHYPELPKIKMELAELTVLVGKMLEVESPVAVHSPLLGVDISTQGCTSLTLPLEPHFEYGIAVLTGAAHTAGHDLIPSQLLYLGSGRQEITLDISTASQIILLGGEPFTENILMYWNFVARNTDEVREAIKRWQNTDDFGTVEGYEGEPLTAPNF